MPECVVRLCEGENLDAFLAVAEKVYVGDSFRQPSRREAVLSGLRRKDFEGRQALFLAGDAARVAARISFSLLDDAGRPCGLLGLFEAVNNTHAARALFQAALDWLRAQGVKTVIGPMDGDTWHRYRLNVGPFDTPPFLMEPYNPAYYPTLWESSGFSQIEGYYSSCVEDVPAAVRETERIAARALARGYELRPFRIHAVRDDLLKIYEISRRIFAKNRFYTEITSDEFLALYRGIDKLLVDGLNWFARDDSGEDVGFVFAFPNRIGAAPPDAVNIKTLGVVPERQRTGVALALMHRVYSEIAKAGYRRANLCLIRDGNSSGRMDGGQGRVFRRYALYQRILA